MKIQILSVLLVLLTALPALAIERQPYVGVGGGLSRLAPDVAGSGYTLENESSMAVSLTLGVPLTERFNGELGYTQLGNAELSGDEDIGYSTLSVGAVAYVLGAQARLDNQPGLRAYVRLGINSMDNQHDIPLTKANNTAIWAGAGLEWPLGERFRVRGELTSFDGDAQALTVALLFQPGARQSRGEVLQRQPVATPATTAVPKTPTPEAAPAVEPVPAVIPKQVEIQPLPKPTIVPVPEQKPAPAITPAPKSGVLNGVEFEAGTAQLTSMGRGVLDRLAASLQAYPGLNVEIGAHTHGVKGNPTSLALTRNRAVAVARHLASNGVSVGRMKARAFGANLPRASGDSTGARRLNNRVEITVR